MTASPDLTDEHAASLAEASVHRNTAMQQGTAPDVFRHS